MRSIDRSNSVAKRPSASASATTATTATSSSSSSAASSTRSSTIRSTAAEGGSSMTCTAAATAAAAGNAFFRPPSSSSAVAARNEASCEDIASTASAEIPPLLAHLSTQFVTATRHHLALGALQYQRCSYRSSTEHYQRAINFLMRREDALARHSHDGSGNAACRHQHRQQHQQRAAIEDELAVEIEKMEFYTYVLRLNNRRDMDVLRNSVSRTSPVTTLTTATATSTSTTSTSAPTTHHPHLVRPMRPQDLMPRCRHAPVLPPPRLAFYLGEHNASYILDSHVRAHQVLANNNIDTAANHQGQDPDPDEQQTIHLLQAYVMYNLALCHVALGSYSEALNLLQMVGDVASTTTGSTSTSSSGCDQNTITTLTPTIASTRSYDLPAELGDIMGRYQSFVKEVRVAAAAAAAATSSSTTATTTTNLPSSLPSPGAPTSTAHNNDDDMDVDRDDDDDDVDEEDGDIPLSLPASAA